MSPSAAYFLTERVGWRVAEMVRASSEQHLSPISAYTATSSRADQWLVPREWAEFAPWHEWQEGNWFIPEVQAEYDERLAEERVRFAQNPWGKARQHSRTRQKPDDQDSLPVKVEDAETHSASVDPVDRDEQTSSNNDMSTTPDEVMEEVEPERYVTIHVVEDGLTVLGEVLPRGFELRLDRESSGWQATVDRNGKSWVDETEAEQKRRRGKVYFRFGPWRGPGKRSGFGTVSPSGFIERPHDEKVYPIERRQPFLDVSQDRTSPDISGQSRTHLLDPIRPRPRP
jgi:hypothetical protein